MATVSVVVITRNEEPVLADCLQSVPFADEIVVVDDGSTDGTLGVARRFTNRIFERRLDRFGRQKQFAIEQATGDWILVLDADERVPPALAEEIQAAVASDDDAIDGYKLKRLTWLDGVPVNFSAWYKCSHLRLFRRGRALYVDRRVHEYPVLAEPQKVARLQHHLEHRSYETAADYEAKLHRYTALAAEDWYDAGRRLNLLTAPWYLLVVPAAAFVRELLWRDGWRGGRTGLRIAAMSARADWMTALRLWSLCRAR